MKDLAQLEETPRFESIRTKIDIHRESMKSRYAGTRKGHCYKHAYSRKQALTQASTLMRQGVPFLRTYKCHCGYWHITHHPKRGV